MWKCIVLFALSVVVLPAQVGRLIGVNPVVVQYLELTDSQSREISRLNSEYNTFVSGKQTRAFQVQGEISAEMDKPDPDPMALGMRYRELEAIRRENEAQRQRTVTATQELLTPPQKQKLSVLEVSLRNYFMACQAVSANLLSVPQTITPASVATSPEFAAFVLGPLPGVSCGATGAIRLGDFTAAPPPSN